MRYLRLLAVLLVPFAAAADEGFTDELSQAFVWRSIGPCTMGGRITDIAVVESRPQVFYVAAATGGVWKTTNNGITFTPVFDTYGTSSIGDIAVCPSNPDIVWVGTGEANLRNSVHWGDGVYKSTDGGRTFQHMGLKDSHHIGRIAIHPKDPDIVYVAALGHAWAPNKERGIYKTTNGGKTWKAVLQIDSDHGGIDVAVCPEDPNIVYACIYSVRRDAYSGSGSPSKFTTKAGFYKSTDGGETWRRIEKGLPTVGVGRGGLDIYRKNPNVLYLILETAATPQAMGTGGQRPGGAYLGINAEEQELGVVLTSVVEDSPAAKAGLRAGDVIKEFDGKTIESYRDLVDEIRKRKPGDKVKIRILRDGEDKQIEATLGGRDEEEWGSVHEISWQDNTNKGGVYRSEDKGETWTHLSATNPRPFYYSQIRIDPQDDSRIYVLGVQLHVSDDSGRRFRTNGAPGVHVDHHAMWINPRDPEHLILGNDGGLYCSYDRGRTWEHLNNLPIGQFYAVGFDMRKPYWVYGGLQDNGSWGGPSRTRSGAIVNEDWTTIMGADGFYCRPDPEDWTTVYCEGQYGMLMRVDVRTGARKSIKPRGGQRWEWNTPIELSPHNPKRVYVGAHKLFESEDRGDTWKEISDDLTKTRGGSISVIGLSPVDADVLWVGTNDGGVWLTRDRGKTWSEVKVEIPEGFWTTRLEPSRRSAGACYLTAERRRKDDPSPYVFRTTDFGKTWTPLSRGLPQDEPVFVIREDPKNPSVLYLGTERTVYVSIDGGERWVRLGRGLPVVPVYDLAVHPRDGELIAATHGRSLWILDVRPLQQLSPKILSKKAHLFWPSDAVLWNAGKSGWFGGHKGFKGQNPPAGATFTYFLKSPARELTLEVLDSEGKRVTTLKAPREAGIHSVTWSLRRGQARVSPGTYVVALTADGHKEERTLKVVPDPDDQPPKLKTEY